MRYTQDRGLAKLKMELNLLLACMNLKKIAIWKWRKKWGAKYISPNNIFEKSLVLKIIIIKTTNDLLLLTWYMETISSPGTA